MRIKLSYAISRLVRFLFFFSSFPLSLPPRAPEFSFSPPFLVSFLVHPDSNVLFHCASIAVSLTASFGNEEEVVGEKRARRRPALQGHKHPWAGSESLRRETFPNHTFISLQVPDGKFGCCKWPRESEGRGSPAEDVPAAHGTIVNFRLRPVDLPKWIGVQWRCS